MPNTCVVPLQSVPVRAKCSSHARRIISVPASLCLFRTALLALPSLPTPCPCNETTKMSTLQHRSEGKTKAAYDPLSVLDEDGAAEPLDDQGEAREAWCDDFVILIH